MTENRSGKFFILYGHGGSYNHGCEALSRATIILLRNRFPGAHIILSTHFAAQDREFRLDADEFVERDLDGQTNEEVYAPTIAKIKPGDVCIHVAGDNYCYRNWQRYATIHYAALERGARSILWSCSIDPEAIDDEMLAVLKTHDLITVREQMTYDVLKAHGLENVVKVSDIAFSLESEPTPFEMDNFIVINLSPLIVRKNSIIKQAYRKLLDYILTETDMSIALTPHVIQSVDNDYDALQELRAGDSSRVTLVSDKLSAGQYKHIVAKARFCVTARTHLAIAAYAACVPTLAIGYNVKSSGIAADIGMGEYVIAADGVNDTDIIKVAFQKLVDNENAIRLMLANVMPIYIGNAVSEIARSFIAGEV